MAVDELAGGAIRLHRPEGRPLPLILDSPHSGTVIPDDLASPLPHGQLLRAADLHVERLIKSAPDHGAVLIEARFARVYLDVNRAADDIDPDLLAEPWPEVLAPSEKTRLGKGLIWRLAPGGEPIQAAPLGVAAVRRRIERCHAPYHALIEAEHSRLKAAFGQVWHVNCHSMKPVSTAMDGEGPGVPRPDVVVSDREGASAEPGFVALTREALERHGLTIRLNDPFKGAEILRRHGDPAAGRHVVQIELNRALYMDEATLAPTSGLADLERLMDGLIAELAAYCAERS